MKLLTLLISLFLTTELIAKELIIDTQKSHLKWTGAKVASSHHGKVPIKSGNITLNKDQPSKANIIVNMAAISNDDLSGKWQVKLLKHLKSADFFSVTEHPNASLKINKFTKIKKDRYDLEGDLTIKGITKKISVPTKITNHSGQIRAEGTLTFDRTDYDIRYNSAKFFASLGDKLIEDEVKVDFTIVTKK